MFEFECDCVSDTCQSYLPICDEGDYQSTVVMCKRNSACHITVIMMVNTSNFRGRTVASLVKER